MSAAVPPAGSGEGPVVVLAPDKFKGSLTAAQVAEALARGLRGALPAVRLRVHPIADGGEGTVALVLDHGFVPVEREVAGPLGEPVVARYALRKDTAVIEMAAAAGLPLLPGAPTEHTAAAASTFGVGQLVADALDRGARRVVLAVGGSATTDGGAGMVAALGARALTADGGPPAPGGAGLARVDRLDLAGLDPRLASATLLVACDVDNPLTGPHGAAAVYGPQKGAGPATVSALDGALARWADVVAETTGRDLRDLPGAGAAGGLGFGAAAVLGARVVSGAEYLLELSGFAGSVAGADLVVVGEGSLDAQSMRGKGPVGVARVAAGAGVPVVAVAGRCTVDPMQLRGAGIAEVRTLGELEPDPVRSMACAAELLERIAVALAADRFGAGAR